MILTTGVLIETSVKTVSIRPATCRQTWSAMRIWTIMGPGAARPYMASIGYLEVYLPDGLPIRMDIGLGSTPGDGVGWMIRLGDLRRSTMEGGPILTILGVGCLDP